MYAIYVERDGLMDVYDSRQDESDVADVIYELLMDGEKRVEVVEQ